MAQPRTGLPTPGRSSLPGPLARQRSGTISSAKQTNSTKDAGTVSLNEPLKRLGRVSTASSSSLSPDSTTSKGAQSLPKAPSRNSIGRPSSVASAASSSSRKGDEPRGLPGKTPTRTSDAAFKGIYTPRSSIASRPPSRLSDSVHRVSSRTVPRAAEVGDYVRIDSISMEGTVRFLGEIKGKPGHWAGVELSSEFAGQGKNDGSVAGFYYFNCPPKCGVFVASNKLSPPIIQSVGITRPGSVTSSRGGRVTPSLSGRATPSFGTLGPPLIPRQRTISSAEASLMAQAKITAGSRASKYIGITAKQLSTRDLSSTMAPPSPRKSVTGAASSAKKPAAVTSSINTTPKPSRPTIGTTMPPPALKSRPSIPSLTTPRAARGPLSSSRTNEMPPPPSPAFRAVLPPSDNQSLTPTFSQASNDSSYMDDLGTDHPPTFANGVGIPRKLSGNSLFSPTSPVPDASNLIEVQRLQALVGMLEQEKKDLKASLLAVQVNNDREIKQKLESEKGAALARVTDLEAQLRSSERTLADRQGKIDAMDRTISDAQEDLKRAVAEGETRTRDVRAKLQESEGLVQSLKGVIEDKSSAVSENDATIQAKKAEIDVLQAKVTRLTTDLEEERRELGGHITDLRKAGQETIALYEERISTFESERYDMEALILSLEEQLKTAEQQPSPGELAQQASTAIMIDNETLKEQVTHLQKRIQYLEDQIDETQANAEREDAAIRSRINRYKEKDAQHKKDLEAMRLEHENAVKAGSSARARIEELEEALKENASTLENHRAEIEGLRTDLSNLEGLQAGAPSKGMEDKLEDISRRAATERIRAVEEIQQLKDSIEVAKSAKRALQDELHEVKSAFETSNRTIKTLQSNVESLETEKADLERTIARQNHTNESSKGGRDSFGSGVNRSKGDNLRDQVAGLKHMVQELQKENSGSQAKIRSLENENKLLVNETNDLKESVKILEAALEENILREEKALENEESLDPANGDLSALQRSLKETRLKYESELDQLRKKLTEVEQRSSKTISELNKEVTDLESLVEAKIYREDDLEREVERLKEKMARLQAKSSSEPKSASSAPVKTAPPAIPAASNGAGTCEICEQPGHDIFSCPLLKDDENPAPAKGSELWCEDCETTGHTAADCPHSLDVF